MLAFDLDLFVLRMFDGLAEGSIYALLALSITVVFRSSGQLNFAQGEMGLFGGFCLSTLTLSGWPVWPAIFASMAIVFVLAAATERVIIRPIEKRNPGAVIVASIGLFLGINQLTAMIWGVDARGVPSPFPSDPDDFVRILGAPIRIERILTIGVLAIVVILLWLLFNKTKIGLAFRAVANNQDSSSLVGIRVGNILMLGWGLAGAISALSVAMLAPSAGLNQFLMFGPFLIASAAATFGGLDSPLGAVIGGLGFGVLKAVLVGYVDLPWIGQIGGDMVFTVALIIILVTLLVRPGGLFGSVKVERV
jgi:branched-chain amino acid transport system permease protein